MPSSLSNPIYTLRSSIPFWEMPDGYAETWRDDGAAIQRRLACLWSQRFDFISDMIGDARSIGGQLRRNLPEEDMELPGFYAVDMKLARLGGSPDRDAAGYYMTVVDRSESAGTPTDGLAIYDVTFQRPIYDVKTDDEADADARGELSRYLIREGEISAENLPLPGRFLQWVNPTEIFGEATPMIFPKRVTSYIWHMVPEDAWPRTSVFNMVGKVNSATFDNIYQAESLLFLGVRERRYQSANTSIYWSLNFLFEYRPRGWNYFFRPSKTGGDGFDRPVRIMDSSKSVYETADFSQLFNLSYT